ncbi:uncharacterized protein B0H18DRAFT_1121309 [Fomitopsis serialis]|uniref:uncharacterized protein n=1 Tax=Fomitopsis serialis TaxID=139415 RepID=UPI002008CDCC|nr:uncharacterized protein B0H18DRAFT_1121309 [Neoantrodia serialis]KAH9921615.1 hypothetical protein B0H18DRAFT_1121309 [Neoantrodia serialis]
MPCRCVLILSFFDGTALTLVSIERRAGISFSQFDSFKTAMPVPDGLIPRPRSRPKALYTGAGCLKRQMRMSSKKFARFRDLMHRSLVRHLDVRGKYLEQNRDCLARHYAEVARTWKDAHKYEGKWPIHMYTVYWYRDLSETDSGSDFTLDSDDDNQRNSARRSKMRVDKPHSKGSARSTPAQDAGGGQVEPHTQSRTASAYNSASYVQPRPGPSQSSRSNTQASHAAAPHHPSDRREPQVPAKPNDGFAAILRLLCSLTPSLEHVAEQCKTAGVKDAERLRVVAGWETRKQRKWLVRELMVDPFEAEVLHEALDEIRRGVRNV